MTTEPGASVSARWAKWRRAMNLEEYDNRWEMLAAQGKSVHGEVDFIERRLGGRRVSILDAGCGTGRLAIEASRRGHHVVGVDLDPDMIDRARVKQPEIEWYCADLSALDLGVRFDVVVMAGNVLLFCRPGSQTAIVESLARHVVSSGILICGFSLESGPESYTVHDFHRDARMAGLSVLAHYATWDDGQVDPDDDGDYAVMIAGRESVNSPSDDVR